MQMQRDNFLPSASHTMVTNCPFTEMQFIRLTAWQECNREVGLLGAPESDSKILHRYLWRYSSDVVMDFCFRGWKVKDGTGQNFENVLSHNHNVTEREL